MLVDGGGQDTPLKVMLICKLYYALGKQQTLMRKVEKLKRLP